MGMTGLRLMLAVGLIALLPATPQAGIGSELDGLGSFGLSVGVMNWLADDDMREWEGESAQPRPIGKALFRYRMNSTWLVSLETGFGWNSYPNSDNVVNQVVPLTIGLERRVRELWGATTSLAFGGGFYSWGRKRERDFLRDPQTSERLHSFDPGAYFGACSEFHVTDFVTCTLHATGNYILNVHSDDFPTVLGGNHLYADVRIGIHYYFSPYEGLIWGGGGRGD